jgi:hypothetical protein
MQRMPLTFDEIKLQLRGRLMPVLLSPFQGLELRPAAWPNG